MIRLFPDFSGGSTSLKRVFQKRKSGLDETVKGRSKGLDARSDPVKDNTGLVILTSTYTAFSPSTQARGAEGKRRVIRSCKEAVWRVSGPMSSRECTGVEMDGDGREWRGC
ncbi:hypothetical protein B0H13DRAFT_1856448 [Mycena leptocephala]|nr:hypothetical protein B0H13DRAFT_1856448 [Mycena leptocephala]